MGGSIVLMGDQFPLPRQQRLWRSDRGDMRQKHMTKSFRLSRQTSTLVVVEPKPLPTKLFLEDPILFKKMVQGKLLLLVRPSGHGVQQGPNCVENSLRPQCLLSRARDTGRCVANSARSGFRTIRELDSGLPTNSVVQV